MLHNHYASSRVIYSVMFYILLVTLIYMVKPSIAFNQLTGEIKPFGVGPNKTVFSLGTITGVLSVVCFYFFCLIDIIFGAGGP